MIDGRMVAFGEQLTVVFFRAVFAENSGEIFVKRVILNFNPILTLSATS